MEEYKRKYSEVSERLMERNRQYQKLQGLYDSLRLRNMVVGVGERDMLPQPGHHDYNTGKNNNWNLDLNLDTSLKVHSLSNRCFIFLHRR